MSKGTEDLMFPDHAEAVIAAPTSLLAVIANAVTDPRIDVIKMQALLDMQMQIVREERKISYTQAMTRLQALIPQMDKMGKAKNSKYAKLEDIDVVIRPLLAAEGFSYSFKEVDHTEKTITIEMEIAHKDGHREQNRLTVPIDQSARNQQGNSIRPAIQDMGSTVSYAKRYLIKNAFNIIEKDEDTNGEKLTFISEQQSLDLRAIIAEVKADEKKFLAYMQVESIEQISQQDFKKALNSLDMKRNANQQEKK